ncbi:MAG: hypothetical protein ACNS63_04490 [Candidatus Nitrospinota bacterium M3_3B_026]
MSPLDGLDPLRHFSPEEYLSFWDALFATTLRGFWARTFATAALVMSFWYGVRRQQFLVALWLFLVACVFTYGAWVLELVGVIDG